MLTSTNSRNLSIWFHYLIVSNSSTHPGRTCQPGSGSCDSGRSSWCGSEAERRPSLPHWPVPVAGTCVREAAEPAAVGSACASLGLLWGLLKTLPHLHRRPVGATVSAAEAAAAAATWLTKTNVEDRLKLKWGNNLTP